MTKIFIEDQELDISKDFSQQITYAIDDLLNIDSKATTFTKTIILPGTARNNYLFGNIFEFANSNFTNDAQPNVFYNFNASKSAKARMEINGLQAMKGVLRLLSIVIDGANVEYEVALFGELGGFVTKLGNKRLTDLDFSTYNHVYNISNITESWNFDAEYNVSSATFTAQTRFNAKVVCSGILAKLKAGDRITITNSASNNGNFIIFQISFDRVANTTTIVIQLGNFVAGADTDITITSLTTVIGSGYCYPLINYGNVSYNIPSTNPTTSIKYKDWQYQAFRPALFVREYIDKIITNAGYTWESNFFDTNFFRSLIIPNNDAKFFNKTATLFVENTSATQLQVVVPFNTIVNSNQLFGGLTLNSFSYSSGVFTYTGTNIINVKIVYNCYYTLNKKIATIRIKKNGNIIASQNVIPILTPTNVKIEAIVQINPNDTITFDSVVNNSIGGVNLGTATLTIFDNALISINPEPPSYVPYNLGETINMNFAIPENILQKDFFTSIMKMFNLMVTEDKFKERHLKIEPNVDYYQLSNYEDWSDKVNRAKPITIKPMSEVNARYYKFNYKQDSDYYAEEYRKKYSESYGNRIYDNQLEFAKDEKSLEVIFSSSVLTGYPNEDKVFPAIYKLNNDVEESITHNIRIMQIKYLEGLTSYKILQGSTTLANRTDYLYCGHLDSPDSPTIDLNFGATKQLYFLLTQGSLQNNIFNLFYSSYMAEITDKDSRLLTAEVKLNEKDIFNLDFSRLKMIDGVLYRMMKVIDWTANELCKAEFLRVINTTYQPNFYVGMEYGGGTIFYLDETGQHGLIVPLQADIAQNDDSVMASSLSFNFNTSAEIGTGLANTEQILAIDTSPTATASYKCYWANIGGYSDWYLPSAKEAQALWLSGIFNSSFWNAFSVNKLWTSTTFSSPSNDFIYMLIDSNGEITDAVRSDTPLPFIPIRSF